MSSVTHPGDSSTSGCIIITNSPVASGMRKFSASTSPEFFIRKSVTGIPKGKEETVRLLNSSHELSAIRISYCELSWNWSKMISTTWPTSPAMLKLTSKKEHFIRRHSHRVQGLSTHDLGVSDRTA